MKTGAVVSVRRPVKVAGAMPTTVMGVQLSEMVLPRMEGERLKCAVQYASLMTATGPAPGPMSSAGVRMRPSMGWTPSAVNELPLTNSAETKSGWASTAAVIWAALEAKRYWNASYCLRSSWKTG